MAFENSYLKVERADEHIAKLRIACDRFLEAHYGRPSSSLDGQDSVAFDPNFGAQSKVTTLLGLILGDAIHNLHSALDQATWELLGLDDGTQDKHTRLQVSETRERYE